MTLFKKIFYISVSIAFVVSFSSCAEEEALTPNPNFSQSQNQNPNSNPSQLISSNSLVGDWGLTSLNYAGTSSDMGLTADFTGVGRDFDYVIKFKDNPKTYSTTGGYTVDLTTSFAGTTFTQTIITGNLIASGTWELNGNVLTTTDDSTQMVSSADILSSPNNNTFSIDYAGYTGQSTQGADVTFSSGEMIMERQ